VHQSFYTGAHIDSPPPDFERTFRKARGDA